METLNPFFYVDILRMRYKIFTLLSLVIMSVVSLKAQSNTTITLPEVHSVVARGDIHLQLVHSDDISSMAVQLYELGADDFSYRIADGILYLSVPSGVLAPKGHVRVELYTPSLSNLSIEGCEVESLNTISVQRFNFTASGVNNFARLSVDAEVVDINVNSRCYLKLSGRATRCNYFSSSASRIDALNLRSESISIEAFESSRVYLGEFEEMIAKVSTLARVMYRGGGKITIADVDLFGKLREVIGEIKFEALTGAKYIDTEATDIDPTPAHSADEPNDIDFF